MSKTVKSIQTFFVFALTIGSALGEQKKVLNLEDGMTANFTSGPKFPITGLRQAAASFVNAKLITDDNDTDQFALYIPEKVVVAAWMQDQKFASKLNVNGNFETLSVSEIAKKGIDIKKIDWLPITQSPKSVRPIELKTLLALSKNVESDTTTVDAGAIIAMTKAGQIDFSKPYHKSDTGSDQAVFKVAKSFADAVPATFGTAKKFQDYVLSDPMHDWLDAGSKIHMASSKFRFENAKELYVTVGSATFGVVRTQSAKEVGFQVDQQIAAKSDTYLFRFAVTFYDLPTDQIDEISFRVRCKSECTAWELAPMRVVSIDEKNTTANTPKVGFEGIEVGEMFKQQIMSQTIKPQIIAYGLHESEFSWSLKDQAIQTGSYVFAAAVSVPKATKRLELDRLVAIKTKSFLGIVEGDWASTAKDTEPVVLLH